MDARPDGDFETDGGDDAGHRGPAYEAHLARSRRVWDRWSDWYAMSERDFEPMREAAMDRLALRPGDRVLDVGSGPGVNVERLRADVGAEGEVVAVDYSPNMVKKARNRVDERGWDNVEVRLGDAAAVDLGGPFDAGIASLSLSVMPDPRAAVENVRDALVPGAPFVAVDVRPFPSGPLSAANPLVRTFLRWYANWNPDADVRRALAAVFAECEVVETRFAGTAYTVRCRRAGDARRPNA